MYEMSIVMCYWCLILSVLSFFFFFFKQKTAYEMRISDWSSDVCSSDLKDVKEPFSGHSAALGIGDGSMRIVDVEDSHTSPRIDDHRRLGRGLRQALKKAPIT